jgi:hypothetical protein
MKQKARYRETTKMGKLESEVRLDKLLRFPTAQTPTGAGRAEVSSCLGRLDPESSDLPGTRNRDGARATVPR